MAETHSGLTGTLEYNTDLFDRQTARRLLEHYGRLLDGIVVRPEAEVLSYELLSQEEKQRQLVDATRESGSIRMTSVSTSCLRSR